MEGTEKAFARTERLLGSDAMARLAATRVAIFGIGGVGGYVAEALARSGVGRFLLTDKDITQRTNLNRQIIAAEQTLGQPKVELMRARILSINPQAEVEARRVFFLPENAAEFDFSAFGYVVDAVDNVTAKLEIIARAKAAGVPVISAMGAGNRLDPTALRVADIQKTDRCPLARVMRRELRRRGISDVKTVFSVEKPLSDGERAPASAVFVPAAMGMAIAAEVVRDLTRGADRG